jgi:predicted nuclease with TOPRIM domain
MKKAIKKVAALIGIGLSLLALLSVLFILVKGWGLRTPLKEGVSTIAGVAEQALQRLEGGTARLHAPVGKALVVLDQVEVAAREWGERVGAEGPPSVQILVTLHDRFSQEMEAADQIASVVGEAAPVFNKSLETVSRFSGLEVPAVTDELAKLSDRFREMKNRLQEFRNRVEGLKAGVDQAEVKALSNLIQWFRAPLTRIQKTLENAENQLAAKRKALIELEGNLLFYIDLGILALSLLSPILMAGQVSLIYRFWDLFRRKEQTVS